MIHCSFNYRPLPGPSLDRGSENRSATGANAPQAMSPGHEAGEEFTIVPGGAKHRHLARKHEVSGKHISVAIHFVWSTAERRPYIHPDWSQRLYAYIGGILDNKKARLLCAGGVADHVHLLVALPSTISIADVVNAMKANSSRWVRDTIPGQRLFTWQKGYGAFSVSKSIEPVVINYISQQVVHHQRVPFQDEFLQLLTRHNVAYNERFIWD